MAKNKKHWAVSTDDPVSDVAAIVTARRKFRLACGMWAWINSSKESGPLWSLCGAAVYRDLAASDPDWYCSSCAKAARLALAQMSAPQAYQTEPTDRFGPLVRTHNPALAKESAQKPAEVSERPNCGDKRTDSERYAELRALVEKWQAAHREHDQVKTTAPETEGRLKRWLNFCDAQKPLLDWNHR